ncbi:threonine/homoserine/homoserine lactone efflux protein [Breoghania corrubedonensis]|uniref:Threonine/homoserine/homoserine lactone efflux protein n=1 Tax=Breoghania corrubedonensis TaxID=665038 RepID=A0A2T5V1C8_9HYPH|nr:LysE family translocator [Breoghania corrubedonensis]PTW57528.1 threonine/homoserine/homoserine lactone efflux protein [Breoghania corrubedonensis]
MSTEILHPLLLVYAAYVIAVASPGPSNMAIMGTAMNEGRGPAVALALGIVTGSQTWALLAATGLSAVLTTFAGALFVIKIAGGLYLIHLAWKSARAALSARPAEPMAPARQSSRARLYRRGLLLHLTNPKAVLGWIAIMSLGLRPGAPAYTLAAILAGCALLSVTIFVGYALVFSTKPMVTAYQRARRWIEGTLALVFGYAGIRLLASRP